MRWIRLCGSPPARSRSCCASANSSWFSSWRALARSSCCVSACFLIVLGAGREFGHPRDVRRHFGDFLFSFREPFLDGADFRSGGDRLRSGLVEGGGKRKIDFMVRFTERIARQVLLLRCGCQRRQRHARHESAACRPEIARLFDAGLVEETVCEPHSVVRTSPAPVSARSRINTTEMRAGLVAYCS